MLAQNPDFVPAQLPLLLGPESKVARREDLATVGVNSYVSPGMCATKKATGDMYGSRQKLWDMTWLYQEISDFALSLIHISEPTRPSHISRMPSSA